MEYKTIEIQTRADPHGLYPPDSLVWQINRESALLLGGLRALLMQIAHPMVAQGVSDHSNFQAEPLGRLFRTLSTMMNIGFGDLETARQTVGLIRNVHLQVKGEMKQTVGAFSEHQRYFATDPALLLWVFSTLIDSSLYMYELLIEQLSDAEKEQYYRESQTWGQMLGIPISTFPKNFTAFRKYVEKMLEGETIAVGKEGRQLTQAVFYPNIPFTIKYFFEPIKFFTVGLLPEVLRKKFGLRWSLRKEKIFRVIISGMRFIVRLTPHFLRIMPQARKAQKRWCKA